MHRPIPLLSRARLLVFDFDGTLAHTDIPSLHGLTVERAYAHTLDAVFGVQNLLQGLGGLRNRAPGELAVEVLRFDREKRLGHARSYYEKHREKLGGLVPAGKGVCLDRAFGEHDDIGFAAEMIVRVKLGLLVQELGPTWPRPCKGVLDFFRAYADRELAIISSGHDLFIEECFRLWGIPCPSLRVTDDDLRGLPGPVKDKTKPSPALFQFLLAQAKRDGKRFASRDIVYIGDDLAKDGELASNSGVTFIWYNPNGRRAGNKKVAKFRDWGELASELVQ